jgi:hypothetical protein
MGEDKGKILRNFWPTLIAVLVGGLLPVVAATATHLLLIPAQEKRIHEYEMAEQKVSKLYQPMLLATGYGRFSIASDIPFYKVLGILEQFGHLADQEVMDKHLSFLEHCKFAGYDEIVRGLTPTKAPPEKLIIEVLKERKPPLKWTSDSLKVALEAEKEFLTSLKIHYQRANYDYVKY